jgi:hypothetical protein
MRVATLAEDKKTPFRRNSYLVTIRQSREIRHFRYARAEAIGKFDPHENNAQYARPARRTQNRAEPEFAFPCRKRNELRVNAAQLPAGGRDAVALAIADGRREAVLFKNFGELRRDR